MSDIEITVVESRKWEGEEIGKDITDKIQEELDDPSFILLFSTIHQKQEYNKILSYIKNKFTESPLVGGSTSGFITPEGVYTRGTVALAIKHNKLEVVTADAHHTKIWPSRAGKGCGSKIQEKFKNLGTKNKILLNFISGPTIPSIPLVGRFNKIKSEIIGTLISYIGLPLASLLGTGVGKEKDVLEGLKSKLSDYYFFGASTVDDLRQFSCFEFLNDQIFTNSVVGLAIGTNLDVIVDGKIIAVKTNKKFNINSATFGDRVLTKVGDGSPKEKIMKELGISEEVFQDLDFFYKTSDYYPIGFQESENKTSGIGAILGENILLGYKFAGKGAFFMRSAGEDIITKIETFVKNESKMIGKFAFITASGIWLNTLGRETYKLKKILDKHLSNIPYLLIGPVNENLRWPIKDPISRVYSFNFFSMRENL